MSVTQAAQVQLWLGTALSLAAGCAAVFMATLLHDGMRREPLTANLIVFVGTSLLAAGAGAGWVSTRQASRPGALHRGSNWGILVAGGISVLTILGGR